MKVVEKDRIIDGMLHDELKRCREILAGLERSLADLPKGVIRERKKRYKDKVYYYYSLKYRDGRSVINKHIAREDLPRVERELDQRKRVEKEIGSYRNRIAYLDKVIGAKKKGEHGNTRQK